ncbi:MAG: serine/threonine protein kinase [Deltaproteobacteria bacterium]|nr:serine/threonine protein kinase [Deltaproteobacteria bacterium]
MATDLAFAEPSRAVWDGLTATPDEILDVGTTDDGLVFLVMEFLRGRDLKAVLVQEGPLPWPRARHFLLQAVAALREAHRRDVIHRDIKPANCFVCEPEDEGMPERMKLLDFGIAKIQTDPSASTSGAGHRGLTQTGELVGTLAYMAPEFADGRPASIHTDMYAVGIMAYQLLTGEVPFKGRNEFQVLARHLNEPPVRPRVRMPTIPEDAESVVLTLLAKKPELRFASMAEVERALLKIPGDDDDDALKVIPRGNKEGSGPSVQARSRESSGSSVQIRRREGSGPKRKRVISEAPPLGRGPRPRASTPSVPMSAVPPPSPSPVPPPQSTMETSDRWDEVHDFEGDPPPSIPEPKREWGTVATIILLALLSAAAIASVVVRQQGIEIPWPWSDAPPTESEVATPPMDQPGVAAEP